MNRESFLRRVKLAVRELEPGADIVLYGSRSRRAALSESDWDFLVLVNGPVTDERTDRIRHRLYELEWDCDAVISAIVRSRDDWDSPRQRATPFHQAVEREGVPL